MEFLSLTDTSDGRLTKGKVYYGGLVYKPQVQQGFSIEHHSGDAMGLRIAVYDDRGTWMTFDPKVFRPIYGTKSEARRLEMQGLTIEIKKS